MKTIGLLGGMSWESTVTYYQLINEAVKEKLGGLHSAKIVLHSVDFDEIEKCQSSGDWARSGEILGQAAAGLERAGADFILICTNTMHKVAGDVQAHISVPLLHIGEVTARALLERFVSTADDNFINYQNADYDALFQQAQATADDEAQTELYKQMERNLTEHAANVYIQDLADLVVLRNGLEGYQFYPIYVMDLSTVHYTA